MINLGFYSGKKLPNVRVQSTLLDRAMEGVALLLWILLGVLALYCLLRMSDSDLPKKALASWGAYTLMMILVAYASYAPVRQFNFPFRVTERTVVVQYRLATRLCRVLNITMGLMFLAISFAGVGPMLDLNKALTFVMLPVVMLVLTVYWVLAYKYK